MHFCDEVAREYGRSSLPVKTSLNCTMPAFANMSVGSLGGTSGPEATLLCSRSAKNRRNDSRISDEEAIPDDC